MEAINNTGICSIVVDGETIPLRFAIPANKLLLTKIFTNPEMVAYNRFDERAISWMLYAGYQNACEAKDEYPVKDFEFFYNFVENSLLTEDGQAALKKAGDVYEASRWTAKYLEELKKKTIEMEQAQKSTGTNWNPSATENLASNQPNTEG